MTTSKLRFGLALALVAFALDLASAETVFGGGIKSVYGNDPNISRRRAATSANPCDGINCPDKSTCVAQGAGPTCVCPAPYLRIYNGKCSTVAIANSDYLDPHNAARAAVGSVPIKWSSTVAASAQVWANYLATSQGCNLIHGPKGNPYGQNLAWESGYAVFTNTDAVNMWVQEGYVYGTYNYNHYTQVVWNTSLEVGCARVQCGTKNTYLWACNYNPPGNWAGTLPYVRDPCFKRTCPDTSTCVSTSGAAVCTCPSGRTLVGGKCVTDPCIGVRCAGSLVCIGSTGKAVCGCLPGTSRYPATGNQCIPTPCVGVVCPSTAQCRVNGDGAPICSCPAGQTLSTTNKCTSTASSTVATSIAVYGGPNFSGPVKVYRLQPNGGCLQMPDSFNGYIPSYKLVWNVADPSLAPGSLVTKYSLCYFWDGAGCYGTGYSQSCDSSSTSATCVASQGKTGYGITCQ